jgi:hypothetical protein
VPWALLALSLTVGWIWHYLIAKVAGIRYWGILGHFAKIILISFAIAAFANLVVSQFEIAHVLIRLALAGFICLALYAPYIYFFEKTMIEQFRKRSN